jgi:hypothetical protein
VKNVELEIWNFDLKSNLEAIKNIYLENNAYPKAILCHEEIQKLLGKGVTIILN